MFGCKQRGLFSLELMHFFWTLSGSLSHSVVPVPAVHGCCRVDEACHLAPRGLALASPLPRAPRPMPRVAPPLTPGPCSPPPRLLGPTLERDVDTGVEKFGVAFEDAGGFSTKEVSVVLGGEAW